MKPQACSRCDDCRWVPTATAAAVDDPIYVAIDNHRQAVTAHDLVVDVRAAFDDLNMKPEQETQLAVLEARVEDAWDRLEVKLRWRRRSNAVSRPISVEGVGDQDAGAE